MKNAIMVGVKLGITLGIAHAVYIGVMSVSLSITDKIKQACNNFEISIKAPTEEVDEDVDE